MKAPYECTQCHEQIWDFAEDSYAGHDIIKCPKCGCRKIIDTSTGKPYENEYNLPGTWV